MPTTKPLVHRMMIASLVKTPGSVVEQLLALRAGIRSFNEAHHMRSAILHTAGWFVQWHEGGAEALDKAWRLSEAHQIHGNARVIHRSVGPGTLKEPVGVATLHGRDKPTDFARRIHQVERERWLGETPEPAQVWQWLSAPCRVSRGDAWSVLARRDVVVLTSEDTESIDLVKSVADRHAAEVSYQRFACADPRMGDAGAAYVDLPSGNFTTRLQALSRRALSNSLVGVSLQQMQCMVLLLGTRPRPAEGLITAVAAMLAGLDHAPGVRLVAPTDAVGEWAAQRLRELAPALDIEMLAPAAGPHGRAEAVLRLAERPAPQGAPAFPAL